MKKEFFALCLILGMIFLTNNVNASEAGPTGCEAQAKIISESILYESTPTSVKTTFYAEVIETQGECNFYEGTLLEGSYRNTPAWLEGNEIIRVEQFESHMLGPTEGEVRRSIFLLGYLKDYTAISMGEVFCENDYDCNLSIDIICGKYIPQKCFLSNYNIVCQKGYCVVEKLEISQPYRPESVWQKILNWFKSIFRL